MKKEKESRRLECPRNSKGMGTVEIVIIIAILVALALIFRTALMGYAKNIMSFVFNDVNVVGQL